MYKCVNTVNLRLHANLHKYSAYCLIPSVGKTFSSKFQSNWNMVQGTCHLPGEIHEALEKKLI